MPNYWVIAPVESNPPELFDRVWEFDLANNLISIGWKELGDVSKLTRDELTEAIALAYPEKPPATKALYVNMMWAFYHEIAIGDVIVARRGLKTLAAVGRVTDSAFYSQGRSPCHGHPNWLPVAWEENPRNKRFDSLTFPRITLSSLTEVKFLSLTDGKESADETNVTLDTDSRSEFVLEKYLEDFIVSNFEAIFKGELTIYQETEEAEGQQYPTDIGPIDILAVDTNTQDFVVIELKKGRSSDQVVGQILRYMGWVKRNKCKEKRSVRGLVICRDSDSKLTYALEMTENISVLYYTVSFKLSESP